MMKKNTLVQMAFIILLCSCNGEGTNSSSIGGSNPSNPSLGSCTLDSSNPEGSGNLRYCDVIFDPATISMTTYKYATAAATTGSGNVDLYMDVYSPPGSDSVTNRPFAIWMHPGGGSRTSSDAISWCQKKFAARGYVCASIDFRGTGGTFTAYNQKLAISDVHAAIRYFRSHVTTFGIDPNRVVLMGSSAGALTAVQAAVTGNDTSDTFFDDPKVNTANAGQPSWSCVSSTLSGAINSQIMSFVDSKDPPNFAYHGELDTTILYSQAVAAVDAMNAVNVSSTLHSFPGVGHSLGNADLIESELIPKFYDWIIASDCPHSYMAQSTL